MSRGPEPPIPRAQHRLWLRAGSVENYRISEYLSGPILSASQSEQARLRYTHSTGSEARLENVADTISLPRSQPLLGGLTGFFSSGTDGVGVGLEEGWERASGHVTFESSRTC